MILFLNTVARVNRIQKLNIQKAQFSVSSVVLKENISLT